MKCVALFVCCIVCTFSAHGQTFEWLNHLPSSFAGLGHDLALDTAENVVYSGKFLGTLDFDPGPGSYELTAGGENGFVSKVTPNGQFLWAHSIGGQFDDLVHDVVTDPSGPIYAAGFFRGEVDFDPGVGQSILYGDYPRSGFLIKYGFDGSFEWALKMGDEVKALDTDQGGNVYITGTFTDTVDIDPGADTLQFASNGEKDIFIAKLSPSGDLIWVKHIGGESGDDLAQALVIDNQAHVYVSGSITYGVDMNPGTDTLLLGVSNAQSLFVVKLDENGELVSPWPLIIRGYEDAYYLSRIKVDHNDNLILTGTVVTTTDFDPGPGLLLLHSNGAHDGFIAKYDSSMNISWAEVFGGTGEDFPQGINVDLNGNIYCSGYVSDTAHFDNTTQLYSSGDADAFYAKYDQQGNLAWAHSFGDFKSDGAGEIIVDSNHDIYVTGWFFGTADFDPSNEVYSAQHNEFWDLFLLKLSKCTSSAEIVVGGSAQICDGDSVELSASLSGEVYEWSSGDTSSSVYVFSEGNYWVTVTDTSGDCSATTSPFFLEVFGTGVEIISHPQQNLLQASILASSYQWFLNGDSISGATGPLYEPAVSGNYQVVVTDSNGCEAESSILEYTLQVGVNELTEQSDFRVYPNPTSNQVNIEPHLDDQIIKVEVLDLLGRVVQSIPLANQKLAVINLDNLTKGAYEVRVHTVGGLIGAQKILKQ